MRRETTSLVFLEFRVGGQRIAAFDAESGGVVHDRGAELGAELLDRAAVQVAERAETRAGSDSMASWTIGTQKPSAGDSS